MRKLVALFFVVSLASLGAADLQQVQYSINAGEQEMLMNTSIYMDCDSSCVGLKWSIPGDSEVLFVRNSRGEMDYSIEDRKIDIPGSRANGRENETVKIGLRVEEPAGEIYDGLYQRRISVPSFNGVETTGFVQNPDLISGRVGFGFEHSFSSSEMRFRGEGPTNLRIKFGEGEQTRYFEFFGTRPDDTEAAYEVPIGVLGFQQKFKRFPVAVMTDPDYDTSVNSWSDGEYVGGIIRIREPSSIENSFVPVLGHEVVHGLNDRELNWDQTRSSYFDEGTAKYVESLLRKKLYNEGEINRKPAELFGDEREYRVRRDGQTYIYTVPPKGDREVLWNYYQDGSDFMKDWNAFNTGADTRSFGYAYSELIIANYIARDEGSISRVYENLQVDREISDPGEKWQVFSDHLDMTPCNYEDRQRFENCLDEINEYDYPIYSATPSGVENTPLQIDRLKVPNRTEPSGGFSVGSIGSGPEKLELRSFFSGFIGYLGSLFQDLAASF